MLFFGPTGVGKTRLLKKTFAGSAEVISADALQVYRGMDIGTAKPSLGTRSLIHHHLIDIRDIDESFSVGEFCHLADHHVWDIHSRGLIPVISGGTAYYMKTWLMGLPATPQVDCALREKIRGYWQDRDNADVHQELQRVDPISAGKISIGDRYRVIRALEVFEQCGIPLSDFPVSDTPRRDVEVFSIGLRRSREDLLRRIEGRVDFMFSAGLEDEVIGLRRKGAGPLSPGMKGIGYREWFGTVDNPRPLAFEVRERIVQNTKRYAKRQTTFFASLPGVHWVNIHDEQNPHDKIMEIVEQLT